MADPIQYATTDETLTDFFPNVDGDNDEQAEAIARLLVAASALIDRYTDRPPGYFAALDEDSLATVRRIRGRGENFLRIGRHVPGSVTIAGFPDTSFYEDMTTGWLFATDVAAEGNGPGGYYADDELTRTRPQRMFGVDAVYQVSARWGFAETPTDIVLACKMIAQHIWDRGQGTFGQITPAGFVIERDIPPPVRLILDNWKRKEFELN